MVSKKELGEQIAELKQKARKAEREAWLLKLDNTAHRARDSARMQRDHAEQQRARQQAEREEKRKRGRELAEGMLRYADADAWSLHSIEGDTRHMVLELHVKIPKDVEPIVHGVLTKNADAPRRSVRAGVSLHGDYANQLQEAVNRIRANAQRARDCYSF